MAKQEEKVINIKPDLEKYVSGVSGSGKKTKNCGDAIAAATDGFTVEELTRVASKMRDIPLKDLTAKYEKLNPGMQAMNLRNLIRGAVTKLDKAHDKDKKIVAGMPTLELECRVGREAANKRGAVARKAADERAAKATANAAKKEAKDKNKK